jgi:hypothetical protein
MEVFPVQAAMTPKKVLVMGEQQLEVFMMLFLAGPLPVYGTWLI